MESFQWHREQLLQMQREQEARMLNQDLAGPVAPISDLGVPGNNLQHSFSSQPTSRFTLDSASAEFAASAVINFSQLGANTIKSVGDVEVVKTESVINTNLVTCVGDKNASTSVVSDAAVTIPSSSFISSLSSSTFSVSSLPSSSPFSLITSKPSASPSSPAALQLPHVLVTSSSLPAVPTVSAASLLSASQPVRQLLLPAQLVQQRGTTNGPLTATSILPSPLTQGM